MYSNPSQTPSWNPNGQPPTPQQAAQQASASNQSPSQTPAQQPQWPPQPDAAFAPRPNQIPPITQAIQPQQVPAMQTLQPPHPDQYRALPAPPQMYPPPYPQPPQMQYGPAQPAPRQRTAIACRYCRRRKIRCSGFDQSEDGRCTNCQRFSQECVFTPVSAQTQAFVPAHSVWRGQQPPPNAQLYGAYGQPLRGDPYAQQSPQQSQQPGQYPPPPPNYQQQPYQQPAAMQGNSASAAGSKRPNDEPHTPTLPPPQPGQPGRPGEYIYPDPSTISAAATKDEGAAVDSTERKLERVRIGQVKDVGVQTDDIWEMKVRSPPASSS